MKVFVAFFACVAISVADISLQQPAGHLEPPSEHHVSKEFNAPWTEKNTWEPIADPQQPINVIQPVISNDFAHQEHQHNNPHQSYDNQQFNNHQSYESNTHHHHQTPSDPSAAVDVEVTHPYWATSYTKVNRFDAPWPAALLPPAPFVAAPLTPVLPPPAVPVVAAGPLIPGPPPPAPAPFEKPSSVVVYNNHVAHWNPWNSWAHHGKAPLPVAKYIAITPGSVHIAPLPGHTVSHKIVNLAPAPGHW